MPFTSAADCIDPPLVDRTWTRVERLEPRKQVDKAPNDGEDDSDDDEWEQDEVTYLTLDFGGKLAVETLNQERGHIQLLGLESSTPYARVGPQFYQGQHETLIGDQVLLQYHPETEPSPSHYVPLPSTSTSRIYFQPISIKPKEGHAVQPTTPSFLPHPFPTPPAPAPIMATGKMKFKSRKPLHADKAPPKVVKVKKPLGRPKGSKNKYKKGQWADEQEKDEDGEGGMPPLPTLEQEDQDGRSSIDLGAMPPPQPPKRRGRPPKPKDPNAPPPIKPKTAPKRRKKRVESDVSLDSDPGEGARIDVDEASEEEYGASRERGSTSVAIAGGSTRRALRRSAAAAAAAATAGGEKIESDDDEA
ncbi:BQ2448_7632 [Microbotryum intermedium]|uniref:BQ2448_7632 protein n=1 Tax=Microbotryum intermedium TaxID=269621 RepID=A0A238FRK8_9BASI|nr:BQ2448_7632 [Microbotryum intermedium]